MTPRERRFLDLVDGWFAAEGNLDELDRNRDLKESARGIKKRIRGHKSGLQINMWQEQREWVRIGEEINFFPLGSTQRLDNEFLLKEYVRSLDPNLLNGSDGYSTRLRDPDYFTRAYSRAVAGLTAPQLERLHLTHFASDAEWQLALAEIQVLRAMAAVYPIEIFEGWPIDTYNLYWFVVPFDPPEVEQTPSSWRDGSLWPGVTAAMRLETLHEQSAIFSEEFRAALSSTFEEELEARTESRTADPTRTKPFGESDLLEIAAAGEYNLEWVRERIIQLLRGGGRDRDWVKR